MAGRGHTVALSVVLLGNGVQHVHCEDQCQNTDGFKDKFNNGCAHYENNADACSHPDAREAGEAGGSIRTACQACCACKDHDGCTQKQDKCGTKFVNEATPNLHMEACGDSEVVMKDELCAGHPCDTNQDKATCCREVAKCSTMEAFCIDETGGGSERLWVKKSAHCQDKPCDIEKDKSTCCFRPENCDTFFVSHGAKPNSSQESCEQDENVRKSMCATDTCVLADKVSCCALPTDAFIRFYSASGCNPKDEVREKELRMRKDTCNEMATRHSWDVIAWKLDSCGHVKVSSDGTENMTFATMKRFQDTSCSQSDSPSLEEIQTLTCHQLPQAESELYYMVSCATDEMPYSIDGTSRLTVLTGLTTYLFFA